MSPDYHSDDFASAGKHLGEDPEGDELIDAPWCERCGEMPATKRTDETFECAECYAETMKEDPDAA